MEPVAIIGVGQTAFSPNRKDQTYADLVYEATAAALSDARLSIANIDNIVTASNDFFDGRTISSMAVGDACGAAFGGGKSISTVEGDGTFAAFYGLSRILSGNYDTTLVVAHSKSSEGDLRLLTNAFFDPLTERLLGLDWVSAAALQARVFLREKNIGNIECGNVIVKNRANGAKNPKAHLRKPLTIDEALRSPLLASPLKETDACPSSDGAAAIILASKSFAQKKSERPIWIRGVGLCADAPLGERNLAESKALRLAAHQAYQMAGIDNPTAQVDLVELAEQFSYQELLWLEELNYRNLSRVNLSGGCLSAHAWIVSGLVRIIEASLQLRGQASNQISNARRAVAHGQYGLCGQSHSVWVLES